MVEAEEYTHGYHRHTKVSVMIDLWGKKGSACALECSASCNEQDLKIAASYILGRLSENHDIEDETLQLINALYAKDEV